MHLYKGVPLLYTGLCTSLEPQLISLYLFVFGLQVARRSCSLLKRSWAIVQSLYQSIFNHSSIKKAANSRDEPVICLHVTDNLAKSVFLKNTIVPISSIQPMRMPKITQVWQVKKKVISKKPLTENLADHSVVCSVPSKTLWKLGDASGPWVRQLTVCQSLIRNSVSRRGRKGWAVPNYTRTVLKISGEMYYRLKKPNLTLWFR